MFAAWCPLPVSSPRRMSSLSYKCLYIIAQLSARLTCKLLRSVTFSHPVHDTTAVSAVYIFFYPPFLWQVRPAHYNINACNFHDREDNVFSPAEDELKMLRRSYRLLIWERCTIFPLKSCFSSSARNLTTTTTTLGKQHITASRRCGVLVAERKVMLRLMKREC